MSFREFVRELESKGQAKVIEKPVSKKLEAAGLIYDAGHSPVIFKKIKESKFSVAANIYPSKELVTQSLKCPVNELVPRMIKALENPTKPSVAKNGPCQEEVIENADLNQLPILFHTEKDGGNYISSGVMFSKDRELGPNISFHRCMQLDEKRFSVRILERHLNEFIERNNGRLDVAMCVGLPINVLLAGAISTKIGVNELEIAHSLKNFELVKTGNGLLVPAETEFVLEGTITSDLEDEGPFVDLTGTFDIIRKQRVFEVKRITHRKNAIWHGLLPGGFEHKILMGAPKEPTIFREVNKVAKCLDVNINPGGCSWLHSIIKIKKQKPEDGRKAIEAAFIGHKSCKHIFVVDEDINIYDPEDVEWAMSTRFQGDSDMIIMEGEKGSSLDPSADPDTRKTTKIGFDLTIPGNKKKEYFIRAKFPKYKLDDY